MTYIIPNQTTKKIVQTNENDLSGNIYVTKNIDLRDNGYIKLSHFPFALMTEDDDARLSNSDVIFKGTSGVFINGADVFEGDGGFVKFENWATATDVPTPGTEEDGLVFNGKTVITDGEFLHYMNIGGTGGNWTKLDFDLFGPCQMAVFDQGDSLVIGFTNKVILINKSWVKIREIVLPSEYEVTALEVNNNLIYIGTRHDLTGEGKLFTWDGVGSRSGSYGVDAVEISSIRKYGASCALLTNKGQLLQFNGSSFNVLGNLPVFYDKDSVEWGDSSNDHSNVSNRGMYIDGEKIYIIINMSSASKKNYFNPLYPSGVWVYTPTTGLNCLNTASYNRITTKVASSTAINTTDNTVTTTGVPITGTPLIYEFGTGAIGGLSQRKAYYTIKVSDTVLKLAETLAGAIAGNAIDITSQGGGNHTFFFFPTYDYGHTFMRSRSSVCLLPNELNNKDYQTDKLIYTADLDLPNKVVVNQTCPILPNRGYFITPKLNSSNTEELYNEVLIKHRPLKTDEKIIIKYRTTERLGLPVGSLDNDDVPIVGTWIDTDTFTTTLNMSSAEVGDEIEIVAGKGAGMLFHIASLSENAGTWTVNLDETFPYAVNAETMYFYVNNFKKLGEIKKETSEGIDHKSVSLNKNSKFLQLKIELRGIDVTIEELQVSNKKFE